VILEDRVATSAQIEKLATESYPEVALLKQVKGVGTLIALTYVLTLEDPRRFRKIRDAGLPWPRFIPVKREAHFRRQHRLYREHPVCTERLSRSQRVRMEG
jgi:hypothetical protein